MPYKYMHSRTNTFNLELDIIETHYELDIIKKYTKYKYI